MKDYFALNATKLGLGIPLENRFIALDNGIGFSYTNPNPNPTPNPTPNPNPSPNPNPNPNPTPKQASGSATRQMPPSWATSTPRPSSRASE